MKKNMGKIDRILRTIFGVAIIGAGIYFKSWFGLIGVLLLVTAASGFCLPYKWFGISTCKVPEGKKK